MGKMRVLGHARFSAFPIPSNQHKLSPTFFHSHLNPAQTPYHPPQPPISSLQHNMRIPKKLPLSCIDDFSAKAKKVEVFIPLQFSSTPHPSSHLLYRST